MADDQNNEIFEAIVIGAGVMGSATAYYLSKELGTKVLLIEQFDLLHRRGSSHGDSRIIRLTYPQDYYTFLMKDAYTLWDAIEKEAGTTVLRKTGGLDFGRQDNEGLQSVIATAKKWQIPHQLLTPSQVLEKFPRISLPQNYQGVYCPETGVLNATKCVAVFQTLARQNGCKIVDNSKITRINVTTNGDEYQQIFEIETTTAQGEKKNVGKFFAKNCVITAGAWSQKVLETVTKMDENGQPIQLTKLPLEPIQVAIGYWPVEDPSEFSGLDGTFPVFINYEHGIIYGSPAIEFPGMIKCGHDYGQTCDPDARTFLPGNQEIDDYILPFLSTVFRGVDTTTPPRTESCMFTLSPDRNFILDQIPGVENLFVGCGFSGHGFKLSPVVGKILAGFVLAKKKKDDDDGPYCASILEHFKLDRFL